MGLTKRMLQSTVSKKYIMAITGIALTIFVIMHLLGNLQLLQPGGDSFNLYAHKLEQLGILLIIFELGLIAMCLVHVAYGINTNRISAKARPEDYAIEVTKGGESKWNASSRNMLVWGVFILVFIVIHVWQFK